MSLMAFYLLPDVTIVSNFQWFLDRSMDAAQRYSASGKREFWVDMRQFSHQSNRYLAEMERRGLAYAPTAEKLAGMRGTAALRRFGRDVTDGPRQDRVQRQTTIDQREGHRTAAHDAAPQARRGIAGVQHGDFAASRSTRLGVVGGFEQ